MSDCQDEAMNSLNNLAPCLGWKWVISHPVRCLLLCSGCDVMLGIRAKSGADVQMEDGEPRPGSETGLEVWTPRLVRVVCF